MANTPIPVWDLSDLYKNIDDPQIDIDQKWIDSKIKKFNDTYKDNKNVDYVKALKIYSEIVDKISILGGFTYLKFSENTQDTKVSNFYQKIQEYISTVSSSLSWFSLLITKLDNKTFDKLLKDSHFEKFKHFVETKRTFKKHILSEKEENIIIKRNVTGADAFVKLYDQMDSSQTYELVVKGKKQKLNYSQITQQAKNHPDREIRKQATKAISETLSRSHNSKIYTFILNTLLLDKKIEDDIRGYTYPEESTFLHYEISPKIVDAVVGAVQKSWHIGEKYYKAKSKLLGHKLYEWDRYSDVYSIKNKKKITWEDAQQIVLTSFSLFSSEFYEIAKLFFDNNWIHAHINTGKKGGAYCSYISPNKHPYVFLNFNETIEDTLTLAHELGHAIHGYLARKHNVLEFDASTTIAEIASTFAESIVFDNLISQTTNKKEKINLLASKIQGNFSTILRQSAFYLFEQDLHKIRRDKGELTTEQVCELYQKHLQPMFGKGLTLTDNHKYFWMPISHFYHYNFYVFTYAFGELLANSLYAIYKSDKENFVSKYMKALSTGGSQSPLEITKIMGVDITKQEFWENGLSILLQEVEEFEKLVVK